MGVQAASSVGEVVREASNVVGAFPKRAASVKARASMHPQVS